MEEDRKKLNKEVERLSKLVNENNRILQRNKNFKRIKLFFIMLILLGSFLYSYNIYKTNYSLISNGIEKVKIFSENLENIFIAVKELSNSVSNLKNSFLDEDIPE